MTNLDTICPEKLSVLQVVNVRWFNATAWYGLKIASLLKESGHSSYVLALENTESFAKAEEMGLKPLALPLNTKNPLEMLNLLCKMNSLLHKIQPDVVNCHRGESFLFWGMLRHNYALIRTRGDQRLPKKNFPNRFLHAQVADAVITTNSVMARYFQDVMHVPSAHIHTIFGGVNTSFFHFDASGRARIRSQYGYDDSHFVIGLLGRFDHVKAQKESIQALAHLLKKGLTQARLLLLGFPTSISQEEVERWISECGVQNEVQITGRVSDLPAYLSALDLGIVPSLWSESIARAALEMMACGVPLISTPVGVMPDLLPQEALIAPEGWQNPQKLAAVLPQLMAEKWQQAIEHPEWLRHLAEGNAKRMQTLRDEDFLQQTLNVYSTALKNSKYLKHR